MIGAGLAGLRSGLATGPAGDSRPSRGDEAGKNDAGPSQPGLCGVGLLQLPAVGDRLENAVGLLKEELRRLDSLILSCADATRVEAGDAWRWTARASPRL